MKIIDHYLDYRHNRINNVNRSRLRNPDISLICSNCAGGFLYHWLGLKFQSPFINLFMNNEDFVYALENFDEFINGEIVEDLESVKPYPVGIGLGG